MLSSRCVLFAVGLTVAVLPPALAQTLPAEPFAFGDGRLIVAGDVATTVGSSDPGFFTYGSYEHSGLRELRTGVRAQLRAHSRVFLLAELRSENRSLRPFAAYVRVRPFGQARVDVQAGRIPPTFGRASRTTYARDNPLPGQPLAYQYLTSLRADAVPVSADELLTMKGRGWLASYSIGRDTRAAGVPLVSSFEWDTGVQITGAWKGATLSGAVTTGSLSAPRVRDDNGGKGFASRMTLAVAPGVEVGASYARGQFIGRPVLRSIGEPSGGDYVQQAEGLDVEVARGHWVTRAEAVASEWRIPLGGVSRSLRALAGSVETRYAFAPGAYAAARLEHLTFNRIGGSSVRTAWEAPVTRLEIGGGYYLARNVIARASMQLNDRDGGRTRSARLFGVQLLYWIG